MNDHTYTVDRVFGAPLGRGETIPGRKVHTHPYAALCELRGLGPLMSLDYAVTRHPDGVRMVPADKHHLVPVE